MVKEQKNNIKLGLLGKNISYSFSKNYFSKKFSNLTLDTYSYTNFDIERIEDFPTIITENVVGLNVTIPYKEQVIPYLDEVDSIATKIGAVNTIKIVDGKLIGYNTDSYGFEESLNPLLKKQHKKALILGTGGASKAIRFVLEKLGIEMLIVSRTPTQEQISYQEILKETIEAYTLIINCTPLGTFPEIERFPKIPYQYITDKHLLYDLIYNPAQTEFLAKGKARGAKITNGLKMLELQAEKSWEIWNSGLKTL